MIKRPTHPMLVQLGEVSLAAWPQCCAGRRHSALAAGMGAVPTSRDADKEIVLMDRYTIEVVVIGFDSPEQFDQLYTSQGAAETVARLLRTGRYASVTVRLVTP